MWREGDGKKRGGQIYTKIVIPQTHVNLLCVTDQEVDVLMVDSHHVYLLPKPLRRMIYAQRFIRLGYNSRNREEANKTIRHIHSKPAAVVEELL